jgi:hypothetical protein
MKKKLLLILAACVVGVSAGIVAAERGQSSGVRVADCATFDVPVNSDYNLTLDTDEGVLKIDYTDAAGDRTAFVDYRQATCRSRAGIGRAIARALQAQRESNAGLCSSMKEFLASGATSVHGRAVDRAAGQSFVARNC